MRAMKAKEIKVWDPLLRLFHWTLLGSFCAAWFSQGELFESLQDRLSGELLQELHVWAGYAIAAQWRSAREMAGDFYDLFPLSDDTFGVVIADVSDKGIPAALFMASARSMVRTHAFAGLSAVETLARTNDLLVEDTESGMFVTVYYSTFHPDGQVRGVNAGHNPPLFCRPASDSAQYLPRGGRALGWFPNNPLHTIDLQMQLGDVIVYYTDGLTDAENPRGDFFGEARLMQVVRKYADGTADELLAAIEKAVDDFCCGLPAFDDLTLCVVRYIGA